MTWACRVDGCEHTATGGPTACGPFEFDAPCVALWANDQDGPQDTWEPYEEWADRETRLHQERRTS